MWSLYLVNTRRKLNVHKTFVWRPASYVSIQFSSCIHKAGSWISVVNFFNGRVLSAETVLVFFLREKLTLTRLVSYKFLHCKRPIGWLWGTNVSQNVSNYEATSGAGTYKDSRNKGSNLVNLWSIFSNFNPKKGSWMNGWTKHKK